MLKKIALTSLIIATCSFLVIHFAAENYEKIIDKNEFEAENFESIGYHKIDGRSTFKMALHQKNNKWYLYCAHFAASGWSILDVTA